MNTQSGGVPGGRFNDWYQPRGAPATTEPSAAPTSRHSPTNPTSASTGEIGAEDSGQEPHSLGSEFWKTRTLSNRHCLADQACSLSRAHYQPFTRSQIATTSSLPSTTK